MRNFVAITAAVFVISLVPVASVASSLGITPVGRGVLALYHLLVAVPLTAFITGVVGR